MYIYIYINSADGNVQHEEYQNNFTMCDGLFFSDRRLIIYRMPRLYYIGTIYYIFLSVENG